jgi:hypothetical protein
MGFSCSPPAATTELVFGFIAQIDGRFVVSDPQHTVIDTFALQNSAPRGPVASPGISISS